MMMKRHYRDWQTFRLKGRRFLTLIAKDGNTHIYGEGFGFFGSWLSVDGFRKHYAKDGEKMNLDRTTAAEKK